MAQTQPSKHVSPPLAALLFRVGKKAPIDYQVIKKAGGFLSSRKCQITGRVVEEFSGDLEFSHAGGETVLLKKRISLKKNGQYDIDLELLRGRNTLTFVGSESKTSFEVDIFHRSVIREWIESILKALVLVLVVKTFVIQAFFIPTPSMEDTLLRHDYILVEKITNLFRKPKSGEIIVFEYPRDPSKDFIKRLIGTEDRVVEVKKGDLWLDGKQLDEPYVRHDPLGSYDPSDYRSEYGPIKIPKGHNFVMGDNRDNSKDSREWGAFPDWRLVGKAWGIYYPITRWRLIKHGLGEPKSG